jgi:hypothetical protein
MRHGYLALAALTAALIAAGPAPQAEPQTAPEDTPAPALVAASGGPRVAATLGRFVSASTTGWEGAVLVDPWGKTAGECQRFATSFGAARGVELTETHAHYTEGELALTFVDDCNGMGVPLFGVALGAGTRSRGREFAGRQATLTMFGLPWPFLQFYARRLWDDRLADEPTQLGLMFKLPIPVWGYDW